MLTAHRYSTPLLRRLSLFVIAACALLLSSCGMMESDSGQDCTTYRRVRFVFDMNMLFSDAFAHEVDSVTLYASDASGKVVYKKSEAVASIVSRGYMDVNDLQPGTSTFRVWATGDDRYSNSYTYGDDTIDREDTTRLSVVVNREHAEVSHDLTPLFFGVTRNADMTDYQYGGVREATVYLTKDTNVFRVVLQNLSGDNLNPNDFSFYLTDNNGRLDCSNNLVDDELLTYRAWSVTSGTAGVTDKDGTTVTGVSAVVAEITTNRLVKGHDMRLHIVNKKDGKEIVNIPAIDYCLLVKGNYNKNMSDQEYLDREDHYDMVFFIDNQHNWLAASIYINSWRVVLQNADING